ncbi:Uncharacterized protein Rs2_14448 [Raphanus sativus]|uniref:Uncharacterized protein LOC108852865 isoform X2 n=1 Tax=Raphanus sativus TaxID=3726 RepID=A0A6J0NDA2_RAPSA|nr:uncharacterized protein LOC108852865 isoform X2 [Raphanus sativus]KAJ4900497.1 Uncharacterized protein Rs2_14448 [Raphanus sativus]
MEASSTMCCFKFPNTATPMAVIALLILETDGYHASLPKSLGSHFDSHFFVLIDKQSIRWRNRHKETVQLLLNLGASVAQVTVEDGTTIYLKVVHDAKNTISRNTEDKAGQEAGY